MKFHHIGIEVNDLQEASHRYRQFGFQDESFLVLNGEKLLFMKKDQLRLELIETDSEGAEIHFCFEVKAFDDLRNSGFKIIEGPSVMNNGWETMFVKRNDNLVIEFLRIGE